MTDIGRHYLAIPGPSVTPDRVLRAMHRSSPNIHEGPLIETTETIFKDLRRIVGTQHKVAIYIANGHGAWEAANANLLSRGDRVLLLSTGQFGLFWAGATKRQGVDVQLMDFGRSAGVDAGKVAEALRADREHRIKAVFATQVDTASSVRTNIRALRQALDQAGHPALLVVDAIASLGCDELRMDDWGVDVILGASQKGLMLPPGLGFVWFSEKARLASSNADLITPYWDWTARSEGHFYLRFGGTPPTQHLFGLREALTMILEEEGLEAVWARHEALAGAVWSAFDRWGATGNIALNVCDPALRARAVTTARIADGGAAALRSLLQEKGGVTLGIGLGMAEPTEKRYADFLRVAHMGHVNAHMTLGALATMEAGMRALGIPHGSGALEAAADAIARSSLALS